jgi:hypothetical protein
MRNPKLFVVGDSFMAPPLNGEEKPYWIQQAADELSRLTGKTVEVDNKAVMGSAQDFSCFLLQQLYTGHITPDDYLIIGLTHPNRQWYFEKQPDVSNHHLTDLDEFVTKDQAKAVMSFIQYIQRPLLDTLHLQNRMAYVAYQTRRQKLRRPLVIKCFAQGVAQAGEFKELNWANGNLMDHVQVQEFWDPTLDENSDYWKGIDPRYNHMCLSNHSIIGSRAAQALHNNTTLDLVDGYLKGIIQPDSINDKEWVEREINPFVVAHNKEQAEKYSKGMTSWAVRMGINKDPSR